MNEQADEPNLWPGFEVAIEGEGLSPADIPVGQLAELLQAAASAVDAIAAERGIKVPVPCLVAVRSGSAAYDLRIRDLSAQGVVTEIERHIKTRGRDASRPVQHALERLHRAGRETGSVRFVAYSRSGGNGEILRVAPPVVPVPAPYDTAAEVYGRVVGVNAVRSRLVVRLQMDDGGIQEFHADPGVAQQAARLFLKGVRAAVEYEVDDGEERATTIASIERFDLVDDASIVAEFDAARDELISKGITIRASDWLRDLQGEG